MKAPDNADVEQGSRRLEAPPERRLPRNPYRLGRCQESNRATLGHRRGRRTPPTRGTQQAPAPRRGHWRARTSTEAPQFTGHRRAQPATPVTEHRRQTVDVHPARRPAGAGRGAGERHSPVVEHDDGAREPVQQRVQGRRTGPALHGQDQVPAADSAVYTGTDPAPTGARRRAAPAGEPGPGGESALTGAASLRPARAAGR